MEYMFYFLIALVALFVLVKVFSWPFKILVKLIINGVLGAALLFIVNVVGQHFGVQIGINAITALIAGFFGVPGVIFLIIFKTFL